MRTCIVFDLDDTLYSEHQYVLSGFSAVDHFLSEQHTINGFLKKANQLFTSGERGRIFNQSLEALGVTFTDNFVTQLVDVYRQHKPEIELFKDAKWALNYYSSKMKVGMITDGYLDTQKNKIESLGISGKFDAIVISDAFGREYWKPHEKPYLAIQSQIGVLAEDCIYVGDNVKKDFITAKRLGWQTICVKRDAGEYQDIVISEEYLADTTITSLKQLPEIL